jgi:RHS repeat-associated protein
VSVGQGARRKALAYDPLGEVADEHVTLLSGAFDANDPRVLGRYRTQFTYDAFGRLQDLTYPDGEVLHHGYNAGGLLDSLDSDYKRRTFRYLDKLEYDEFEARRLQVAGNGVRTTYSYDLIGRPVRQVTDGTSRGEVQDLNHSYDRVGNLRGTDNLVPQSGWTAPTRQAYAYDSYHRLSSATGRYGATREYTLDTAYDLAGNVVQKRQSDFFIDPDRPSRRTTIGATSFTSAFTYHPTRVHQITKVNGRNYTHDADGNLTGWYDPERQERLTATWDAADRMRNLRFQGQRASESSFTYDDEGALVAQGGTGYQHGVINRWFTVPNIDDHLVKHVFAGSDRLATVNYVGTERSAHFLHKNLQGSAQVVTDQRRDLEEVTELFPSGEVWVRQSDETERPVVHQFAGGYLEPVRGITNLGSRWYEPRDGVFLATDPLLTDDPAAAVQNSALLPDYTYAESNPLRLVDSDGLASISALKAYSTAIGAALRPDQPAAAQRRAQTAANVVSLLRRARNASAGQGAAPALQLAAPPPTGLKGRASRLWQRISRKDDNPVEGLVDSISAKPLVSFKFKQGEDGWGLSKIKLAPTFGPKQFTVFRKPAATTAAAPAAAAPPGAPAAPPAPGADAGSTALVQRPRAASSAGTQVR